MFGITIPPLVLVGFAVAFIIEKCRGRAMSLEELCLTAFLVSFALVVAFFGILALLCH